MKRVVFYVVVMVALIVTSIVPTYAQRNKFSENEYMFISKLNRLCMDVEGDSRKNGASIIMWGCDQNYGNQRYTFDPNFYSDPNKPIIAWNSRLCLDIEGGSAKDLAKLIQWQCHRGDNQKFSRVFVSVGGVENKYFKLVVLHSGKCLETADVKKPRGTKVIQNYCHGGDSQLWYSW